MSDRASEEARSQGQFDGRAHSRELFWTTFGRLILLYFAPLLLLSIFFHLQYRHLVRDSLQAHLEVIAEHQAYHTGRCVADMDPMAAEGGHR
jgi:hypothetical protein